MNRFAILCLAIVVGPLALSQQPAEWRPNIAEDNKAATWEDTSEFLRNSINNGSSASTKVANETGELAYGRANSDGVCSLGYDEAFFGARGQILMHEKVRIDFDIVDPLSVSVIPSGGVAGWQARVRLEGSREATFATVRRWQYNNGTKYNYKSAEETLNLVCDVADVKCLVSDSRLSKLAMNFREEEFAKRFARGLMHAALLCGGTKAVSPF